MRIKHIARNSVAAIACAVPPSLYSLRGFLLCGGALAVTVFFALHVYSYVCLLEYEKRFMPEFSTLSTPHVRRVSAHFASWTVAYYEDPVTDLRYVDPSITVNIFGRISDASSKEVYFELYSHGIRIP